MERRDAVLDGLDPIRALGMMSGTSLDGIDAAVLTTDGLSLHDFGPTGYRRYTSEQRAVLRGALNRWSGPEVDAAARVVEDAHLALLADFAEVDLVGFHGQTLAHEPRDRGTLQVGSGQRLADATGLPVLSDFRTADVTAGGEGAPLAPFFHFACARWAGAARPLAFLNLGGVANLTWIDPSRPAPESDGALLAFDTGPASALIDDLMLRRQGLTHDKDGAFAASGHPDPAIVTAFLADSYFDRPPPKSLDRNAFRALASAIEPLADAEAAATLTAASAAAVVRGIALCPSPPSRLLVAGGGRHNDTMMGLIAGALDCPVDPVEAIGLDGDMLEAQAFAYLAVRAARGLPTSAPGTTGVPAPVCGGILNLPSTG